MAKGKNKKANIKGLLMHWLRKKLMIASPSKNNNFYMEDGEMADIVKKMQEIASKQQPQQKGDHHDPV